MVQCTAQSTCKSSSLVVWKYVYSYMLYLNETRDACAVDYPAATGPNHRHINYISEMNDSCKLQWVTLAFKLSSTALTYMYMYM